MLNSLTFMLIGIVTFLAPAKVLALDSCGTDLFRNGVELVNTDGNYKLVSTQTAKVGSNLKEDFIKSLFEAESNARTEILRFLDMKCIGDECFHPKKISDPPKLNKQLEMMVTSSKCHIRKRFLVVKVEYSL